MHAEYSFTTSPMYLQRVLEQRALITHLVQLLICVSFSDLVFRKLCILLVASPQKELK
jgi:hypothetical protein